MMGDDSAPVSIASPPCAVTSIGPDLRSQRRNSEKLTQRLAADALSAASAAVLVAPMVSIIDRSIMENASGRNTLMASIHSSLRTLLLRPRAILLARPFALIFMVYGGTYLTANTLDTAMSTKSGMPASHVTSGTAKFAASSAANVGLCIYKDQVFVRIFGPPGVVARTVPLASYAFFALRDCLTIFASFNVPPRLGPYLDSLKSTNSPQRLSGLTIAQFTAPAAIQLFSTPLHLLGLDMYNKPANASLSVSWRERLSAVRKNWAISSLARICRIVPAFGIGGVVNNKVRKNLMTLLE